MLEEQRIRTVARKMQFHQIPGVDGEQGLVDWVFGRIESEVDTVAQMRKNVIMMGTFLIQVFGGLKNIMPLWRTCRQQEIPDEFLMLFFCEFLLEEARWYDTHRIKKYTMSPHKFVVAKGINIGTGGEEQEFEAWCRDNREGLTLTLGLIHKVTGNNLPLLHQEWKDGSMSQPPHDTFGDCMDFLAEHAQWHQHRVKIHGDDTIEVALNNTRAYVRRMAGTPKAVVSEKLLRYFERQASARRHLRKCA